jgi:UDP-glucose 4-epimerase
VAGFIGSRLARHLLGEGARVIGLDDLSQGTAEAIPAEIDFVEADIRTCSWSLLAHADAVAHLAARNCLADCEADPDGTWSTNVVATERLAVAARAAGVRRFLLASSSAVYECTSEFPTPESVPRAATSVYGHSKIAAEAALARQVGLAADVLRYFNVYGPGQDYRRSQPPVLSSFVIAALCNRPPVVFGTGQARRDYVHVDDVNVLQAGRLLGDAVPQCLNVGSGVTTSVLELLALVDKSLGPLRPRVHRPAVPRDNVKTWADIRRARALGWSPRKSLDEGIAQTAAFLQEQQDRGLLNCG